MPKVYQPAIQIVNQSVSQSLSKKKTPRSNGSMRFKTQWRVCKNVFCSYFPQATYNFRFYALQCSLRQMEHHTRWNTNQLLIFLNSCVPQMEPYRWNTKRLANFYWIFLLNLPRIFFKICFCKTKKKVTKSQGSTEA